MKPLQMLVDKIAISLSLLCIAHCLLLPIALAILPVIAVLPLEDELFHQLLVLLVLPTSVIGLTLGCKRHKRWKVAAWGASGLSVVALSAILGHDLVGDFGERFFTLLGSLLIAWGHLQNYRLCRKDVCH